MWRSCLARATRRSLDLLITTDTALANLAGACGCPAFIALRAAPDWRWGIEGERTLFFPTLRLFRQDQAGDWAGVFARMADAVREEISARGPGSATADGGSRRGRGPGVEGNIHQRIAHVAARREPLRTVEALSDTVRSASDHSIGSISLGRQLLSKNEGSGL